MRPIAPPQISLITSHSNPTDYNSFQIFLINLTMKKKNLESWEPWMWAPTECKQVNGLKRTGWAHMPSLILSSARDSRTRHFHINYFNMILYYLSVELNGLLRRFIEQLHPNAGVYGVQKGP